MIEKMKELAFKMHNQPSASQRYGNAPYSIHLEAVVEVMKRFIYYISEDKREIVYAAGYGHDLIEDTEIYIVSVMKEVEIVKKEILKHIQKFGEMIWQFLSNYVTV